MEYGLIGEKLGHSFSKLIHNMLGDYGYELYSLTPQEMKETVSGCCYKGFNVTIPYKQAVMPLCDSLSQTATEIGSVNTLVVGTDGSLYGDNTDQYGFIYMVRRASIDFAGKKVLILGSGGTSLTAVSAAKAMGATEIVVVSRRGENNYGNLHKHFDSEIIVNTTPVGMYPNNGQRLIDLKDFPKCQGVADVVYNPFYTALLLDAMDLGIPCCNGLPMLVAQAKRSAELFTGSDIPDGRIEEIHAQLKRKLMNLVLIGMPGSGKSSVGGGCAAELDKEFIDTDNLIMELSGRSIQDIFTESGEATFRDIECEAVARAGKQVGKVISTGGGAILREENYRSLRQNGIIVFVERELDSLEQAGRPLSKDAETIKKLYELRLPLYKLYSQVSVDNNGQLSETVNKTAEVFYEAIDH